MKFIITNEVLALFPSLKIGLVVGTGMSNGKRAKQMDDIITDNMKLLNAKVIGADKKLSDFPNISAWRETYRTFGVNPKKFVPTAEAFLKRMLKGTPFPSINAAVDAYLAVELLTMLPIGGYDFDTITGDIVLRISPGGETFFPLGGGEAEYTTPNELVYTDERLVLTRNWNFKDCEPTKISEKSTAIILACEIADEVIAPNDLTMTIQKIIEYESLLCGGQYRAYFLDSDNPVAHI